MPRTAGAHSAGHVTTAPIRRPDTNEEGRT